MIGQDGQVEQVHSAGCIEVCRTAPVALGPARPMCGQYTQVEEVDYAVTRQVRFSWPKHEVDVQSCHATITIQIHKRMVA